MACLQPHYFSTFSQTVLRNIVDTPWYIRNADLRRNLQKEMVSNETGNFAKKHEGRVFHHVNFEAIYLLENSALVRRISPLTFKNRASYV